MTKETEPCSPHNPALLLTLDRGKHQAAIFNLKKTSKKKKKHFKRQESELCQQKQRAVTNKSLVIRVYHSLRDQHALNLRADPYQICFSIMRMMTQFISEGCPCQRALCLCTSEQNN